MIVLCFTSVYSVTFGVSVNVRYSGDNLRISMVFSYYCVVSVSLLTVQYRNNLVPTEWNLKL